MLQIMYARCILLVNLETTLVLLMTQSTVQPTNGLLKPLLHAKLSLMAIKVQVNRLPLSCATPLAALVTVKVLWPVQRVLTAQIILSAHSRVNLLAVLENTSTEPLEKVLAKYVLMDGCAQEDLLLTPSVLLVQHPTLLKLLARTVVLVITAQPVGKMMFCLAPMARTPELQLLTACPAPLV